MGSAHDRRAAVPESWRAQRPTIASARGNKIEHRLFSFISINWRCRLRTFETVVNLIANTTNRGGLVVRAQIDRGRYPTGEKISAKEFRAIKIEADDFHGEWNYVIRPRAEAG